MPTTTLITKMKDNINKVNTSIAPTKGVIDSSNTLYPLDPFYSPWEQF